MHVYCYGNSIKFWVPFISRVTERLIFQNPVTNTHKEHKLIVTVNTWFIYMINIFFFKAN